MANQEHVDILVRDGVHAWNRWRKENRGIRPDLSKAAFSEAQLSEAALFVADLSRADLRGANLSWANLIGATLVGADLREADLIGADVRGADLRGADLRGADLIGTDLSLANLSVADLSRADLSRANLSRANLIRADLSVADLSGADLSWATCLETKFIGATLTDCTVYGISAWGVNSDGAKQADLRITIEGYSANITVDNLEVAQCLHLLLTNRKMRNVLDTITSKVVLILGRFSEERKPVLDAVREALRSHANGYIPALFDFEPQPEMPIPDTVKTLANLARFVIADLTDPNIVRSELTCITANVPTAPVQPIIQRDAELPTEYATWREYTSFLPIYRYDDLAHLLANLKEAIIMPVEGHVVARRLADADTA